MSKGMKIFLGILAFLVISGIWAFSSIKGTYSSLVALDENLNGAWSQVQNVYQRRADLILDLVEFLKSYDAHERETLEVVIQARANATRPQINTAQVLQKPQLFQQFEQAQDQLGVALDRLMVVIERYPELKANTNFIRLHDELASTENKIAVKWRRFNQTVQGYNQIVRSFPTLIFARMFSISPLRGLPQINFPEPVGFVNDFVGILNYECEYRMSALCLETKQKTGVEIVVVVIKTTYDINYQRYAQKLFNDWGIGEENIGNGILIFSADFDRKLYIEVGFGLEKIFKKSILSELLNEIIPYLRKGAICEGLSLGLKEIVTIIRNELPMKPGFELLNLQSRPYTCGPAALVMVMKRFGVEANEDELAELAGTTSEGTSLWGLAKATKAKGYEAIGMLLTLEDLKAIKDKEVILLLNKEHFTVYNGIDKQGRIEIFDPVLGIVSWPLNKFLKLWEGYSLLILERNTLNN